uniref:Uncharacterized protein n=1 Tax=Rhizophora mucronata TaxID=61149 RepID=A0A2P2Q1H5_RHIMU
MKHDIQIMNGGHDVFITQKITFDQL